MEHDSGRGMKCFHCSMPNAMWSDYLGYPICRKCLNEWFKRIDGGWSKMSPDRDALVVGQPSPNYEK